MRVVVRAMRKLFSLTLGFVALLCLCAPSWAQTKDSVLQFQLSDQLKQSAAKWNRGDLAGFMEDYLHSEELTFTWGSGPRGTDREAAPKFGIPQSRILAMPADSRSLGLVCRAQIRGRYDLSGVDVLKVLREWSKVPSSC